MSHQSNLAEFGVSNTSDQVSESDPADEKLYRNEKWLQEQYCEREKTLQEIAGLTDVTKYTISNWMKKYEIERRSSGPRSDGDVELLKDEEWLRRQYCNQRKSADEIADERSVHKTTVIAWMKKYEIERRSPGPRTDGDLEPLKNEEWIREQYCDQKKSTLEIADELDLSEATVTKWMQEHDIERRSPGPRTDGDFEPLKNEEWLREQYCDQKKSTLEIADELDLSETVVRNQMDENGIERRSSAESLANGNIEPLKHNDWLREQYHQKEKTTHEIADELDLSVTPVVRSMERHGIERRSSGPRSDGDVESLKNAKWLREQYYDKEKSTYKIADSCDVSRTTVRKWMQEHDIERRSPGPRTDGDLEPLKNEEWLRGQYCEQEKTTYEIADELDLGTTTVTRAMREHGIEIKSLLMNLSHLSHRVLGEIELDIANQLSNAGVDYEYESEEIEYGEDRTYIPDFVTEDYIIECKGANWGAIYNTGVTAEQKAKAAMRQLDDREYVVVGIELPCDIHIPRDETETIHELF